MPTLHAEPSISSSRAFAPFASSRSVAESPHPRELLPDCTGRTAGAARLIPRVLGDLQRRRIADHGELVVWAISEHVENAGVHSGDATLVLPPQRIYLETMRRIKKIAEKIAKALGSSADAEVFEKFSGTESLPFNAGKHKRIAVKVIDPRGNEVMTIRQLEA